MAKNQFSLSIDFSESTISSMTNIFPENIEAALNMATTITLQNVQASSANHNAVPAYYDTTNKKLYSLLTGDDYWAVDGNALTYTLAPTTTT